MSKYKKVVDAVQWHKVGDHPEVVALTPELYGSSLEGLACGFCGHSLEEHGSMTAVKIRYGVCPGDWILTEKSGRCFPCKAEVFEEEYEEVSDEDC